MTDEQIKEMNEAYDKTIEFLDKVDIMKYIPVDKFNIELPSVMIAIINDHYRDKELMEEPFCGHLFAHMTDSEFADYLRKRYKDELDFNTVTTVYLTRK